MLFHDRPTLWRVCQGGGGYKKLVLFVFVGVSPKVIVTYYTLVATFQNPDMFLLLLALGDIRRITMGFGGISFVGDFGKILGKKVKSSQIYSKTIPFDSISHFQVNPAEKSGAKKFFRSSILLLQGVSRQAENSEFCPLQARKKTLEEFAKRISLLYLFV